MSELNKNMLSPVGFDFRINKTPDLNFFVQSVVLPGVNIGTYDMPTPFKTIPIPGDHITYGELDVTFKINETLSNYIEIFNWITGLGFPNDFDEYANLKNRPIFTGKGIESDATLTILSSAMNPIVRVEIKDLFPITITPLELSSTDTSIEYLNGTVSFRFLNYKISSIK